MLICSLKPIAVFSTCITPTVMRISNCFTKYCCMERGLGSLSVPKMIMNVQRAFQMLMVSNLSFPLNNLTPSPNNGMKNVNLFIMVVGTWKDREHRLRIVNKEPLTHEAFKGLGIKWAPSQAKQGLSVS